LLRGSRDTEQQGQSKRGSLADEVLVHEWLARRTIILREEMGGECGLTLAGRDR
jgi:hypothetical protein